ncbi:protein FAR1-RELATED SEQUENCE 5-like [Bidens hawaiensis]|uniref:protein FAR1-RELATED SEQUENCE 5-like n=1 Tax=Bidens hawaiensis TaxID=980011 RepID=UPI00404B115D
MVATLHRQGLSPAKIKSALKKSFPGNKCITRDMNNVVKVLRDQDKIGDTPMQVLENFLQTHGFTFYTWENPSTNRTENVFFSHEKSHTMWRAFPDLLLIDTTYNTNMYKWPFVQFVGVTSTSKSFCIAHAVIFREQECNFTWGLEFLKDMLVDCREPRVILTDRDQALMNACETVFPNATKNLCRWHIMQNIQRKHKSLFQDDISKSFNYWWKVLYESPTKSMYDYNCGQMEVALVRHGRREAWYYIRDNWLVPYKEKFVSCWIDDRLNFGEHTTNRVEGQHANLKRHLSGPNNSLDSIAAFALEVVNSQMEEISATLEDSRVRIKKYHKLTLFEKLHNRVSLFAIAKLDKELTLLDTLLDTGAECDHRLQTSWGLSCACKLNWHTINNIRIPLKDIDPFWRKLDFSSASVGHEEPDYEAEQENVKKQVLGLKNRMQKKKSILKDNVCSSWEIKQGGA